MKYIYLELSIF